MMNMYNIISIFDFAVSKKELNQLYIYHYTKEDYLKNNSAYTAFVDLAHLFRLRNNLERCKHFLKLSKEVEEFEMEYELS